MPDLIEVIRGDTPTVRVGPVKRNGVPVNFTGAEATLTVKADPDDVSALFQKTGILATIVTTNDGFDFVLTTAETDDPPGEYVWDVQVVESGGSPITTFPDRPPGIWRILADVNRA
jgi:hypothetical protein